MIIKIIRKISRVLYFPIHRLAILFRVKRPKVTFLPAHEDVFQEPKKHSQYFIPLCSVSLQEINPLWTGNIHFIATKSFEFGRKETILYHTKYAKENTISFKITDGNKMVLEPDFKFFTLENTNAETKDSIVKDYEDTIEQLIQKKQMNQITQMDIKYLNKLLSARDNLYQYHMDSIKLEYLENKVSFNQSLQKFGKEEIQLIREEGLFEKFGGKGYEANYGKIPRDENGQAFTFIGALDTSIFYRLPSRYFSILSS